MKQILLMSALALGLCACGPGNEYRAPNLAGSMAPGPSENNNASCGEGSLGAPACGMTHEPGNSGADAHDSSEHGGPGGGAANH